MKATTNERAKWGTVWICRALPAEHWENYPFSRSFLFSRVREHCQHLKSASQKHWTKLSFFSHVVSAATFAIQRLYSICGTYNFTCSTHVIPNKTKGRLKKQLVSANLQVVGDLVHVHTYWSLHVVYERYCIRSIPELIKLSIP